MFRFGCGSICSGEVFRSQSIHHTVEPCELGFGIDDKTAMDYYFFAFVDPTFDGIALIALQA